MRYTPQAMTDKAKKRRRELAEQLGVSRRTAANIIRARRAAAGHDIPPYTVATCGEPTSAGASVFRGRPLAPEEKIQTHEEIATAEDRADLVAGDRTQEKHEP